MIYFFNSIGKCLGSRSADAMPDDETIQIFRQSLKFDQVIFSTENHDFNSIYLTNGQIVKMGPKPSPELSFNHVTHEWVDARTQQQKSNEAKANRNQLLAACDWTQLPDVPTATQELWAPYRQALRDITDQPGFPDVIEWPVPPV